jgi:hypothetical protein
VTSHLYDPKIGATGVSKSIIQEIQAEVPCIVFDPTRLQDRTYPTLESTAGVGEYIYGDALGCQRSERTECLTKPYGSDFYFGPQLEGVIGSGDTIIGDGFGMVVSTNCTCYDVNDPILITKGKLVDTDISTLNSTLKRLDNMFIFLSRAINITENNATSSSSSHMESGIEMTLVLGNSKVCGGYNSLNVPVCETKITDAVDMRVQSTYNTDGTPASIALVKAEGISKKVESITTDFRTSTPITYGAIGFALTSIFPPGTYYSLTGIVPGMISPLLYWTSTNLMSINPAIMDAGLETTVSMLLRGGIARTFNSEGSFCPMMPVERNDQSIIKLTTWGLFAVYMTGAIQLLFSFMSLFVAMIWLIHPIPLGPAIRIIKDPTYFMALLAESSFSVLLHGASNAQRFVIWQALDTVVRIGETLEPLDDSVGKIKMDR